MCIICTHTYTLTLLHYPKYCIMLGYRKSVYCFLYPHNANFILAGSSTEMDEMLLAETCSSISAKAQFSMRGASGKQAGAAADRKGSRRVQTEGDHGLLNWILERPQVAKRGNRMASSRWGEKGWALQRNSEFITMDKMYENTTRGSKHHDNAYEQMQWAGLVAYVNPCSDDLNRAVLIYVSGGLPIYAQ